MKSNQTQEALHKKMIVASLSSIVAESCTFPIDIVKTNLQVNTAATSSFNAAYRIVDNHGFLGLYRGLTPALIRHLLYTPLRIVGYEQFRGLVLVSDVSPGGGASLVSKALVGGFSGVLAQVVASPADLVKVRLQADGCLVSRGLQPRYSGPVDALTKIIRTEGVQGLWRGVIPNVQRAFLVNMGELACYDHAKHFIIRNQIADDNIYAHTLSSIMSGLSATTLSCPADVVKTRMMNQAANEEGKLLYKNSYDCLVKTVKVEGARALWKGFFPTWARLGPWQFVFWVSYEKFRQIAGFSSF
ncbi:hypothetical protein vseg_019914 [Gypsophila vaccaria]